jgi:hypothetical protein
VRCTSESKSRICSVEDLQGLEAVLANPPPEIQTEPESVLSSISTWKLEHLSSRSRDILNAYLSQPTVVRLGETASVSIGCVTGANDFFVLTDQQVDYLNVGDFTKPVVTRNNWIAGPVLTSDTYDQVSDGAQRNLLTLPSEAVIDGRSRLGRYLRSGVERGLPSRRHCQRDPWWSIEEPDPPDAFMPYTLGTWRGLSLNTANITSTNTVHQVRWTNGMTPGEAKSIVLSTWSSVGQLLAELLGRGLGGGVLKFEVSDATRFPVARGLGVDSTQFGKARHSTATAQMAADAQLESGPFQFDGADLRHVQESTRDLIAQRRGRAATTGAPDSSIAAEVARA